MKSSFDQEIRKLMQENVFDNLASGAWGATKWLGQKAGQAVKTGAQAAYGASGAREAVNQLGQAGSNIKTALFGPQGQQAGQAQQPAQSQQAAAPTGRSLKSIPNIDNHVLNVLNSAKGITPSDKAILKAQIPAMLKSLSTNMTDQDFINIITATLSK